MSAVLSDAHNIFQFFSPLLACRLICGVVVFFFFLNLPLLLICMEGQNTALVNIAAELFENRDCLSFPS